MLWFNGSIPDAINAAKQRSVIFVVVIAGEDDQSSQLMSSWEDAGVSAAAGSCCVAIRLDAKSDACVQFSQIYPVVCIPSSFFIGDNGIPLEVIAGSVAPEELMRRINRVQQMHSQEPGAPVLKESSPAGGSSPEPSLAPEVPAGSVAEPEQDPPGGSGVPGTAAEDTPSGAAAEDTPSGAAAEDTPSGDAAEDTPSGDAAEDTPSGDAAEDTPSGAAAEDTPSGAAAEDTPSGDAAGRPESEENLEEKVERLTKKLEERREEKKKGEEENEIKKEMERRKLGKNMQDFKKKQEEDKTKRLLEERNREKAEEKAARERVRQQIAMDRADRAARYAKSQDEEKAARQALLQARQAEQEARKEELVRQRSTVARIQFRLPDGSSFTNQFPSQTRLQEAWNFAATEVGSRYGNFSLATMFPRREFNSEDMNRTLLDLELAPSASIVLLPQSGRPSNTVVQSSGQGFWAALGTLLYPLLAVWRFLSSFLFTPPTPSAAPSRSPASQSNAQTSSRPSSSRTTREPSEKQPKDFKKDGNICRLRSQDDSEDDNNTWNGNSTQQM